MNLIELNKQIKYHKILEALFDGIADGLLYGENEYKYSDDNNSHYYKIGYDFGCTIFSETNKEL